MKKAKVNPKSETDVIATAYVIMGKYISEHGIDSDYAQYVLLNILISNMGMYLKEETLEEVVAIALVNARKNKKKFGGI